MQTQRQFNAMVKKAYLQYVSNYAETEYANSVLWNKYQRHNERIGYTKYSYYLNSSVPFISRALRSYIDNVMMQHADKKEAPYMIRLRLLLDMYEKKQQYYELLHQYQQHKITYDDPTLRQLHTDYNNTCNMFEQQKKVK